MEPNDIFVYNNLTVRWTGRKATRQLTTKQETLLEIEPLDKEEGSWKKWVREKELFVIQDAPS